MSQQTYYDNPNEWGNYSYVTLEQVVTDYLANRNQDDYTFSTPRHQIIYQAKRGLREFYFDVLQEIKGLEVDLSSNLQVELPPDYVNYVRISWVDEDKNIYPISSNRNLRISEEYLQDNQYNLLFDVDGNILLSSEILNSGTANSKEYNICKDSGTFTPNVNYSEVNEGGSYRIDKDYGVIRFNSTLESKTILLEYISDGLFVDTAKGQTEDDIRIHKFAEQAVLDRIYYYLIKTRRNVPYNEKQRAKKDYYNSRRIAKRRISQGSKEEIIKAMKGANVWIKE